MPKSYLQSQPAAQRGFRQKFDPYSQVYVRLKALEMTGHEVSKVELRILGGTWSSYRKSYQAWFVKRCLQAMNEYGEIKGQSPSAKVQTKSFVKIKSLGGGRMKFEEVVKENETAVVRCIGINIETRPDFVDLAEVKRLRRLGVTKVEMGVQTTDDKVQELTRRGHDLQSVQNATKLLKDAGFKVGYHMMPNLEGSTIELDKGMIGELFEDDKYQPDYLKLYPCVVIPGTMLARRFRKGLYKPYDDETLFGVLYENMKSVPEWCRIDRVARDIPADEIEAGFKVSNIRQLLEERLDKEGVPCRDIRNREIRELGFEEKNVKLLLREYEASGGKEIFLSYEDVKQDKLIALLRLRFPAETFIKELSGAAIVREVHVYGKQIVVGKKGATKQHAGWGAKLMKEAEKRAKKAGYSKLVVIAGIGTREYYRKFGYELEGTYMVRVV